MPGVIPEVFRLARWIADAGFTAYVPSMFGTPGRPFDTAYAVCESVRVCVSREFSTFAANRSSRIVVWMRALARRAFDECGGRGVGALGMCLSGNFALAMMIEPFVLASILSRPSLPIAFGPTRKASIGVCAAEIAAAKARIAEGSRLLALRFHGDPLCPPERFQTLRGTFGEALEVRELDPQDANAAGPKPAHSVLTMNLVDEDGSVTKDAALRCVAFLREQLAPMPEMR